MDTHHILILGTCIFYMECKDKRQIFSTCTKSIMTTRTISFYLLYFAVLFENRVLEVLHLNL